MKTYIKPLAATLLFSLSIITFNVDAQEYVSPTKAPLICRSPGVKVKLISGSNSSKTYCLIFAPGDEVLSGLKEFAIKYQVKSARITAIGDAKSAKFGWYDKSRKMFKVIELNQYSEITSLVGDIALDDKNEPVVHCHINLATEDGTVHGGHLLEAFIEPTLEVLVTVEPEGLHKKTNAEFGVSLIDPGL